jgi:hypothetical protein
MPRCRKINNDILTQTAIDLYKLAMKMEREGVAFDDEKYNEVSLALHRELHLKPWDPFVLDVQLDSVPDPRLEPMRRKSFQRSIDIRRALALAVHQGA